MAKTPRESGMLTRRPLLVSIPLSLGVFAMELVP